MTDLPTFAFSVSHTTRTPRPGEVDGVHYNFVDRSFMLDAVSSGTFFIEHAEVHGNMYGSSFGSMFLGGGAMSHGDDDGGGGRDRVGGGAGTGTTFFYPKNFSVRITLKIKRTGYLLYFTTSS
jgi:hypothetical protein